MINDDDSSPPPEIMDEEDDDDDDDDGGGGGGPEQEQEEQQEQPAGHRHETFEFDATGGDQVMAGATEDQAIDQASSRAAEKDVEETEGKDEVIDGKQPRAKPPPPPQTNEDNDDNPATPPPESEATELTAMDTTDEEGGRTQEDEDGTAGGEESGEADQEPVQEEEEEPVPRDDDEETDGTKKDDEEKEEESQKLNDDHDRSPANHAPLQSEPEPLPEPEEAFFSWDQDSKIYHNNLTGEQGGLMEDDTTCDKNGSRRPTLMASLSEDSSLLQEKTLDMAKLSKLWAKYCAMTAPLAQRLCEQLRLVLEPQVASRLAGDYSTGKRLNMRRVIPFIASGYRKDKIWLRRSKPSKRCYQVLMAIDDSKTMSENHAGAGAIAALVTLTTGLRQLEVGDLALLRFGDDVKVLRDFDAPPIGAADGAELLSEFTFNGGATPATEMLKKAIEMFDRAEFLSGPIDSPHQIMFVVSDGRFEQSQLSVLRHLNRLLAEKQRLVVLVIMDDPAHSIMKERRVIFRGTEILTPDYLEDYPFPLYVVLNDITQLPGVLSDALKQWFELVNQNGE